MTYAIQCRPFFVHESDDTSKLNAYATDVANGNRHAFSYIYTEIHDRIRHMTYMYESDPYDREDLEQECYVEAYILCFRYNPAVGDFRNYLFFSIKRFMKRRCQMKRYINKVNTSIEAVPGFYELLKEYRYDTDPYEEILIQYYIDNVSHSSHLSYLEKQFVIKLMNGSTISDVQAVYLLNEESFKNTYYRVLNKIKAWHLADD